ncbi:MAG TPA: tetratricopeptide repeat protein [Thermoanaerobaculia bacterium]|nr:tetratricopeptide repeat protein [Thermoanaerobaculia bacterium]
MTRKILLAAFVVQLAAGIAFASWYDDYDDGLNAVRKGQWQSVVQKMSAAIKGHSGEDNHARTYGAIFINYHPYYYRGLAYLNLGQYEKAVADFEKTSGPGEVDQGPLETLMERAKSKLAAETAAPPPQPAAPVPQPVHPNLPAPQPVQPSGPVIDSTLRQRAQAAINEANQHLAAARQRKAMQSPQYGQALQLVTEATTRSANPKSNDDLNAVIALAENAVNYADSASAPNAPVPQPVTRPVTATRVVIADTAVRVRHALENYFNGEFDDAAEQFGRLSQEMPQNAWIWAFLGASQYSQYAFEADDTYRDAALQSFRKAKQLRSWREGLPRKYFSKRIRKAFENAS